MNEYDYETQEIPTPTAASDEHFFEVKLAVLLPPELSVDRILECVIASCLKSGIPVAAGLNAGVKNITSIRGKPGVGGGHVRCTGFENIKIKKSDTTVKIIRPVEKKDGGKGRKSPRRQRG